MLRGWLSCLIECHYIQRSSSFHLHNTCWEETVLCRGEVEARFRLTGREAKESCGFSDRDCNALKNRFGMITCICFDIS